MYIKVLLIFFFIWIFFRWPYKGHKRPPSVYHSFHTCPVSPLPLPLVFFSFFLCRACHHRFTSSLLPFSAPSSSSLNLTSIGYSLGRDLQHHPFISSISVGQRSTSSVTVSVFILKLHHLLQNTTPPSSPFFLVDRHKQHLLTLLDRPQYHPHHDHHL